MVEMEDAGAPDAKGSSALNASLGRPASHDYRSAAPFLASSSPCRQQGDDDDERLRLPITPTSSPPIGPPPRHRTNSANDPFSAASKAERDQHPSFGKEFPHVKHPGRTKRPLPPSPGLLDGQPVSGSSAAALLHPPTSSAPLAWRSANASHRRSIAGPRRRNDHPSSDNSTDLARERALARAFELSDDAPTSDDHLEAAPWEQPSSDTDTGLIGLGVGQGLGFQEEGSPSAGRHRLGVPAAITSSGKRSAFSRSSSINDPFGALGSTLMPTHDHRPTLSTTSPRSGKPLVQRRRLVGTSPKKLTTIGQRQWGGLDSDSDDGDGATGMIQALRGKRPHPKRLTMAQTWHKAIEQVWDSGDTRIDVSDSQLDGIHPIVADLAKYVAIEPPRSFEPTASTSSLPGRVDPLSRQPSSRTPVSRTLTSSHAPGPSSSPAPQTSKGKLQLYLVNNNLTTIPSALFEVGNLRVLSLRKNNLSQLPSAIGQLRNLRELNIGDNQLRYLPSEIQMLTLDVLTSFPNPFFKPPADAKLEVRSVYSITGSVMAALAEGEEEEEEEEEEEGSAFVGTRGSAQGGSDSNDDESMETDFIASHQDELSTPGNEVSSTSSMGPPGLPFRFTRGPAGVLPQPPTGSTALPRRIFDRTRSDAQVDDLLARGGGRMLGRQRGPAGPSTLSTTAEATTPTNEDSAMDEASTSTPPAAGMQVVRVLGPLKEAHPALPSLRELCIRRLLSPCEASQPPSPSPESKPETSRAASASTSSRPVVWARVPSTSLAFQHQTRRPVTLLESYENGVLRELEADQQMEARTISLLESARRSMEGKWGSGSGVTSTSRGNHQRPAESDSWCKGVSGKLSDDGGGLLHRSSGREEDDADASSPGSDDGFDQTIVSLSPSLNRQAYISTSAEGTTTTTTTMNVLAAQQDIPTKLDSQGDDSTLNPHFNRCPNPLHSKTHWLAQQAGLRCEQPLLSKSTGSGSVSSSTTTKMMMTTTPLDFPMDPVLNGFAPLFSTPGEERVEWVSHVGGFGVLSGKSDVSKLDGTLAEGHTLLPILWRGCSKGCLRFLVE